MSNQELANSIIYSISKAQTALCINMIGLFFIYMACVYFLYKIYLAYKKLSLITGVILTLIIIFYFKLSYNSLTKAENSKIKIVKLTNTFKK